MPDPWQLDECEAAECACCRVFRLLAGLAAALVVLGVLVYQSFA